MKTGEDGKRDLATNAIEKERECPEARDSKGQAEVLNGNGCVYSCACKMRKRERKNDRPLTVCENVRCEKRVKRARVTEGAVQYACMLPAES